uniref:EGF-like domain-containing protein 2 n=1 Tax=Pinctada maxima TaxID=104660 RepID=ELDP2_PINMA|nr:RecName: Full=EGF-like domain-containing protein 2; Flags: Precursor [Pinctada maxima]
MPPSLSHLFLLSTFASLALCSFYCKNPGYPCLNGGTCLYNGECNCTSGFRGFNCGLDSSTISAACTVECHNKGICFNGDKCYCTKDYMGPTCQQAYDFADCNKSSMKIKAYRPTEFNGEIFLMQSMFGCKLTEVTSTIPGYKQYELDVPHDSTGPCKLKKTIDATTGDVHFEVNVSTIHHAGQFGMYDGLKTVSCHYSSRDQAIVKDVTNHELLVSVTTSDGNTQNIQEIQTNDVIHLTFNPVNLPGGYKGVKILDLEMYSVQWNEVNSILLLKDQCMTQKADELGYSVSNEVDGYSGRAILKAIPLFENVQASVYFNYRLRFCRNRCKIKSCPSQSPKPMPMGEIFKHQGQGIRIV